MIHFALIAETEIYSIIPLLQELNPNIAERTLQCRLDDMLTQGYRCVGVFDEHTLIGISGLWLLTKYYIGRHIEMDNVYLKAAYRNQGIGQALVQWVDDYAKTQGCVGAELNCYTGNTEAHRFWEENGYHTIALHFQKKYV